MLLQDEKLKAVVGASGGAMIIAGTTEVILNHLRGMDPLHSVLAPRVYHQVFINVHSANFINIFYSVLNCFISLPRIY